MPVHKTDTRYLALFGEAVREGVSERIAQEAVGITRRHFASAPTASSKRVEAYFWAVVRRRAIRDRSTTSLTSRLVLDAVVADLRLTGRDDERIREELEMGWRGCVPDAVLDEVASRLCA